MKKLFGILHSDTVDIPLRRSSAEQLSVVLQGEVSLTQSDVNKIENVQAGISYH